MSGNVPPKTDRRSRRTRDALGDALIALMQEKPFDAITVEDVLKRANVSRSTFYEHYLHKEDLLFSDAEEFFQWVSTALTRTGEKSRRVAPVREFFSHVATAQQFYLAMQSSGKAHDLMELARGFLARGIEQRLAELRPDWDATPAIRAATAEGLAGAMLSMLEWWVDRKMPESPDAMDDAFHRLVWP